jgi:hypothetical protein
VSNFDDEFTKEQCRLSSAKDRRVLTARDQQRFNTFDYVSATCTALGNAPQLQ